MTIVTVRCTENQYRHDVRTVIWLDIQPITLRQRWALRQQRKAAARELAGQCSADGCLGQRCNVWNPGYCQLHCPPAC